ncbi:MFS transporter [Bifidobacterium sp. SMB2]|uniref:MFS transporter n=1 Tax=Bifidobacterium saimiriisciurei TaxID=2661627 RepID=A0ABX0C7E2_9BIFI|nr:MULTISPECIES: MFS transporter [Bifidobacterium]NEG96290.1 MFS transporter [Bifidobacterium sp. SMB2]NEH11078.1 MFS transporter [Bifidobacterium saimiriisciurei]
MSGMTHTDITDTVNGSDGERTDIAHGNADSRTAAASTADSARACTTLGLAAGLGSFLGAGTILALSSTLALWRTGLGLNAAQVGAVSAVLTFAFAAGSFCGGFVAQRFGLVRLFNINAFLCAAALAACTLAPSFIVLAVGIGVAALAVGMDLPVSISVITHDVPDETLKGHLVSRTQVLWSAGILGPYVLALIVAPAGFLGARMVFGIITAVALFTAVWRVADPRIARLHREAAEREAAAGAASNTVADPSSVTARPMGMAEVLRSIDARTGRRYALLFAVLALFYVMWNLMANTINQFQTYLLVSQHASQMQAVFIGIVSAVLCVLGGILYGRVPASGPWRARMFWLGAAAQVAAMAIMAAGGTMWSTAVAVVLFQFFGNFAGEMNAKVWTQETFPVAVSAEAQSLILGIGRIPCAFASLVLPSLLVPGVIDVALWAFVAVAALAGLFGGLVVRLTTVRNTAALAIA